jgi:hypothetical protein
LPLHIYKDPHGPRTIDGATLKTDRSMLRETLLLVGGIRDAVVVTSALFLQEFLLALRKRFAVKGWILCRTLGLTGGGRGEAGGVNDNVMACQGRATVDPIIIFAV